MAQFRVTPCFHFKNGHCNHGDYCKFVHEIIPCPKFPNCSQGARCAYAHPDDQPQPSMDTATATTTESPLEMNFTTATNTTTSPPPTSDSVVAEESVPSQPLPPSNFRTVPCIHFKNGTCVNGDACTFLHARLPCKFGVACQRGERCPYDHEIADAAPMLLHQPSAVRLQRGLTSHVARSTPYPPPPIRMDMLSPDQQDDAPMATSSLDNSLNYRTVPCLHFKRDGSCPYGDECTFLHELVPCKKYPNCPHGQDCRYVHPVEDPVIKKDTTKNFRTVPCIHYKRNSCTKGDFCSFLHQLIPCRDLLSCPKIETCPYVHSCT